MFRESKIATFFLIFSISILIYITFKSEFVWEGTKRQYYTKYYLIFIILAFFSIVTFFLKNSFNQKILLFFLSIYLSLFFLELYLSISLKFNSQSQILETKKQIYKQNTSKSYDTRTQVEIYEELKKFEKISLKLSPKDFLKSENDLIPLSGISNIKTIDCNENGYFSFYNSDRYGFNNNDSLWDEQTIKYLLIGDSFTQGACVNPEKNFAGNLSKISNANVLNLGFTGNGPLLELATLKEYFHLINTKKILWFYFEGNDNYDLSQEIKNNKLIRYFKETNYNQQLFLKQKEINEIINNEIQKKVKFNKTRINSLAKSETLIFKLIKLFHLRDHIRKYINENYSFKEEEFKQIMIEAKKIANKNSAEIYFIYLPEYPRYKSFFYSNSNLNKIEKIISEVGLNFLNIDELVFKKIEQPLNLFPFKMHGHYNEEGYKIISNVIYSSIN